MRAPRKMKLRPRSCRRIAGDLFDMLWLKRICYAVIILVIKIIDGLHFQCKTIMPVSVSIIVGMLRLHGDWTLNSRSRGLPPLR